jgi:hypothetical protein
METKIIEGFIVYNSEDKNYTDKDGYETKEIRDAEIFENIEKAKEDIEENVDYPNNYEIHKVKFIFETEEVYKRKVSYEIVEGKVESEGQ